MLCSCSPTANTTEPSTALPSTITTTTAEWITDYTDILSRFSLRTAEVPDDDTCYIVPGRPETIAKCSFNLETQTFLVIHGWTVRLLSKTSFWSSPGLIPGQVEPWRAEPVTKAGFRAKQRSESARKQSTNLLP